ncbi:MAG: peptidase S10 [Acidobacteriia bacterium]|nr:peptidase S10 [Terriglobia bacterium]
MNRLFAIGSAILLAVCAAAQQRGGNPPAEQPAQRVTIPAAQQQPQQQRERARTPAEPQPPHSGPAPEEKTVVTHHSARIGGQQLSYTATAATYVIKAEDDTPKVTFFFVAYTRDDVPGSARRPVAFVYNGGPGSASLFTHMGMGPRRVVLTPDGHGMPAPYSVVDDEDSFLDASDLVFVDAIGTGYSRPAPGQNTAQFYGIVQDANYFADFIYQYLTRNERWASPKFLIGESYGTTRSAELAGVLQQRHQIYLNGIVLLSSVAFSNWGADDRSKFFLPTYTVTAWYHHLLPPDLQGENVEAVAQAARQFAHGEYAAALEKGDQLAPSEYQKVVADLARFTGLSPKYIEHSNLRISPQRWFKELERDQRKTIGRLDSRFEGMDADAAGERNEYDSSEASYEGAYSAAFQDYVRRELKWPSDMYYAISGNVRPWDQTGNTAVAEVLRAAMTQQTNLKVLVRCGYYDVATPFNGIEETVSHMSLEPPMRKNVAFAYYESGHMIYIDRKAHDKLHKDVDEFINSSYSH